jgi:uncharacterized protein YegP (UPF0339 family)
MVGRPETPPESSANDGEAIESCGWDGQANNYSVHLDAENPVERCPRLVGRDTKAANKEHRMKFEVVTHQTPREGVRYHGRFKLPDSDQVIWRTELYAKKEGVYACIKLLAENAASAEILEVTE